MYRENERLRSRQEPVGIAINSRNELNFLL